MDLEFVELELEYRRAIRNRVDFNPVIAGETEVELWLSVKILVLCTESFGLDKSFTSHRFPPFQLNFYALNYTGILIFFEPLRETKMGLKNRLVRKIRG